MQAEELSGPEVFDRGRVSSALEGLPSDSVVQDAVEVFKALSNPTRIRVMHALAHDELCVGDLAHVLSLSMSTLSHQLALLRRLKLISAREVGRQTFYKCADGFVGDMVHSCLTHVESGGTLSRPNHHHPHKHQHRGHK